MSQSAAMRVGGCSYTIMRPFPVHPDTHLHAIKRCCIWPVHALRRAGVSLQSNMYL